MALQSIDGQAATQTARNGQCKVSREDSWEHGADALFNSIISRSISINLYYTTKIILFPTTIRLGLEQSLERSVVRCAVVQLAVLRDRQAQLDC